MTKMRLFFFCILCVCTPDSQSSVKENKLNIFKTDKSEKILYCLMCKKKKHCADDVELPECSDTQHEEQKVCVKFSRRSRTVLYVSILLNATSHGPFSATVEAS